MINGKESLISLPSIFLSNTFFLFLNLEHLYLTMSSKSLNICCSIIDSVRLSKVQELLLVFIQQDINQDFGLVDSWDNIHNVQVIGILVHGLTEKPGVSIRPFTTHISAFETTKDAKDGIKSWVSKPMSAL